MDDCIVRPELLQRVTPFCWLLESHRTELLASVRRRKYCARAVIQRTSRQSDGVYAIIGGRVNVVHEDAEGREVIAASVGPGEFFGEVGLFEGHRCAATFRADSACDIAYAPRTVMLRCLEQDSAAALRMLRVVTARLCDVHRKMAHIALASVYDRVLEAILAHSSEEQGERVVQIGAEHMARVVAASREMVTRVIGKLIEQHLVRRCGHRKLVVADPDRLRDHLAARERASCGQSDVAQHAVV